MQNSFRDFFTRSLVKDKVEAFIPNFSKFLEMALGRPGKPDIVRHPVNIDQDDIEFLQQFPHEYWAKALKQRYNLLFKAIKQLDESRLTLGHDNLKAAIYNALKEQTPRAWMSLKKLGITDPANPQEHINLNEKDIEELKAKYPIAQTKEMDDATLEDHADMEANDHLEKHLPHVENPEPYNGDKNLSKFEFKSTQWDFENQKEMGSNRAKGTVVYAANPFLNRLYHKLNRTKGLGHLEGSGLESGQGKYGFYMRGAQEFVPSEEEIAQAKKDKQRPPETIHTTAGMKFPTSAAIAERVREFMVQNSHRVFGELPTDGSVKWMPTKYEDTETIKFYRNKYEKMYLAQLAGEFEEAKRSSNGKKMKQLDSEDKRRKLAVEMAKKKMLELAKEGKLVGPSIPGVAEKGLPVKIEGDKLINPRLYLPFKKEKVRKVVDGKVQETEHFVPIVNPGKFYKEFEADEIVPDEMKHGHQKNYKHLGDNDNPYGRGVQKDAALDFNHNTEKLEYLPTAEEKDALDFILSGQQQVDMRGGRIVPSNNSGFYSALMQGVLNCAVSKCGGNTKHEQMLMLQNIREIHQVVFATMRKDLGNYKSRFDSTDKIAAYARAKASLYAQKDLGEGGGTRRLRAYTQALRNIRMKSGTPSGARQFDTTGHRNAYKLHNLRSLIQELMNLRQRANVADTQAHDLDEKGKTEIGSQIATMLRDIMKKRANVANDAIALLAAIHVYQNNSSDEDANKYATDQVDSWLEDGLNSTQLTIKLLNLPIVKQIQDEVSKSGDTPLDPSVMESGLEDEIKAGIQIANLQLSKLPNIKDPEVVAKYKSEYPALSPYVSGVLTQELVSEFQWLSTDQNELAKVQRAVQKEINAKLDHVGPLPKARIGQRPAKSWPALAAERTPQAYWHVAHDPDFHKQGTMNQMSNLRAYFDKNKEAYHPEDHASAVNTLSRAIQARSGV
jgi:hypothetical protein